jgi:uncharacterized protein
MTLTLDTSLKSLTDRLVAVFKPEKIILFGSYAWGTPTKDSDVDICVIVKASNENEAERMVRANECASDIKLPVDILVKTRAHMNKYLPVKASLMHKIQEQGKVLYVSQV